ncbi:MAG: MlaD family protein [Candidatus Scalindua sp.]|nr:MlaD family protein [Candidatus Scalindua sp.]
MKKDQIVAFRAGLFVFIMLIAVAIVIFVLGKEKGYFKKQFTVYTSFPDVFGLLPGAPVRLAGLNVGKVADITIPQALKETKLVVTLQIEKRIQNRIREDSVASIKWLSYVTGDSYIELSMGSENKTMIREGDFISGVIAADYSKVFESGIKIIDDLHKNLQKLEKEKIIEILSGSAITLTNIFEEIKNGNGMIHHLIYTPAGKDFLDNLSKSSENVKKITQEIVRGDNILNALISNKENNDIRKRITGLLKEIEKITKQITGGNGFLHAILYDEEQRVILENLIQVTKNLKTITGNINDGEGSLGAIINDPVLYDNLNQILGGANRSFILRTLIRHSLKDN